jgi:hypothetical protein
MLRKTNIFFVIFYRALTESLKAIEKGEPLPFPSHPALAAALQQGPDGDKTSLGNRALESCAYLVRL